MNINDSLDKFTKIIERQEFHPNYDRTVEVAKFAYSTTTGDQLDDLITSVRTRESDAQKKQRTRITKALSPVSTEMVKKYFRKIRKTDGVKVEKKWTSENKQAQKELENQLTDFYARQGVEEYLFDVMEDYTFLDPNAFLVINRENVMEGGVITGVRVYPSEFPAECVRHFMYKYGVLDWLLIEQVTKAKDQAGAERNVSEFRMYCEDGVLHVVEYMKDKPEMPGYLDLTITEQTGTNKTRTFVYAEYLTGTTEVPAIRLGAYLDGQTKSDTAVTPMEPVKPLIEQLINVGSLHDLTVFLHSISRRKELVESCDYEDQEHGVMCENGYIGAETICPKCKGTGDKSITSEQDMIRIKLPDNFRPEDIPDLSKMAHTEQADVALLEWQQGKIDWLLKFIVYATMTRDAVTMAEVSKTATEMVLNNQEAYDKIQPYAELYSQAYMMICRVTTQYQDHAEGFLCSHRFPDDYQFETEGELLDKLEKARSNGAPFEYIARLQQQLIRRQTRSTEEAERAKAWAKWKPWPDMTDEMLSLVLADRDPRDPKRVLRENFFQIRTEIEEETDGKFYLMSYEGQQGMIETKTKAITESTMFRGTEPVDFPMESTTI